MVLMQKPSVIDAPSSGAPEKAPRWDLTSTEGCGGGNRVSWCSQMFSGYVGIYRRNKYVGGRPRGPRDRGARHTGGGRPPISWGPHCSTDVLLPPIYTYVPQTIRGIHENLIPPPQPSVPVRSHLGAFSGAPPAGASITEGFYINTIASPMTCEQFTSDFRSIVISQMASSLFLDLNTMFSPSLVEIYSM